MLYPIQWIIVLLGACIVIVALNENIFLLLFVRVQTNKKSLMPYILTARDVGVRELL